MAEAERQSHKFQQCSLLFVFMCVGSMFNKLSSFCLKSKKAFSHEPKQESKSQSRELLLKIRSTSELQFMKRQKMLARGE